MKRRREPRQVKRGTWSITEDGLGAAYRLLMHCRNALCTGYDGSARDSTGVSINIRTR